MGGDPELYEKDVVQQPGEDDAPVENPAVLKKTVVGSDQPSGETAVDLDQQPDEIIEKKGD